MAIDDGLQTKSIEKLMADQASMRKSIQELTKRNEELEQQVTTRRTSRARNTSEDDEDDGESEAEVEAKLKKIVSDTVTDTINGWWNQQQKQSAEESQRVEAFITDRNAWLTKAYSEFPEAAKKDSALSKRAMEIFKAPENKMANERGLPLRPDAEYDAYARASLELNRAEAANASAKAGATFAAAGGTGAGGGPSQKTELSDEEFLALSPAERDKYQREKAGL